MRLTIAQLEVTADLDRNKEKILSVLDAADPGDWVTFPECALTGYFPETDDFLVRIDPAAVSDAVAEVAEVVRARRCVCLLGTATCRDGAWYNTVLVLEPDGTTHTYDKVELSALDRRHFTPGTEVPSFDIAGVRIGVQVCRELVVAEPWLKLRNDGTRIVFHINNAIKPHDAAWRHVVIARAIEHGYYVCSTNNAAPPQELTSYLAMPYTGELLIEADRQTEQVLTGELPAAEPVNPY
jgi:NAD+ synthase (glutamine-hydrolysing)